MVPYTSGQSMPLGIRKYKVNWPITLSYPAEGYSFAGSNPAGTNMSNWMKGYSEALGMQFACRMNNGHLETWTEDKTYYSEQEINTVSKNHGEIDKQVHILKHMFNGTIIS